MHMPRSDKMHQGFTLVEIALVTVIIALIVGGVMVGTNLLRSAKLRSIMIDREHYQTAIENFKEKYKALPGDMANATDFWGAEEAIFTDCAVLTTPSTSKKTCNGDGNDSISQVPDSIMNSAGYEIKHEYFRMWQHLANGGFIDGSYTGVNECSSGGKACYKGGINAPDADLRNTTWAIFDMAPITPQPSYIFSGTHYRHVMYYGGENKDDDMPFGRILSPKEAWNIDLKFDDSSPGTGKIMSLEPVAVDTWDNRNDCATSTDPAVARYNVTTTNPECMLLFRLPF